MDFKEAPAEKMAEAVATGEGKLDGAPPATFSVALRADFVSEGRRDVVRAMFEVAWWPMLGAFSQVSRWAVEGRGSVSREVGRRVVAPVAPASCGTNSRSKLLE